MNDENIKVGGNIELSGFRVVDSSSMIMVKKIIGNHARRISDLTKKMDKLHITLKPVHQKEKSEKYEVHAKVIDDGKVYTSKVTERNLLSAIDSALRKIVNEMD